VSTATPLRDEAFLQPREPRQALSLPGAFASFVFDFVFLISSFASDASNLSA
jgi:hypothetical protein